MPITSEDFADKMVQYLQHAITLPNLIEWAEAAIKNEDFGGDEFLVETVARLGLADVRAFGLTWEDCQDIMQRLGYKVRLEILPAGADTAVSGRTAILLHKRAVSRRKPPVK